MVVDNPAIGSDGLKEALRDQECQVVLESDYTESKSTTGYRTQSPFRRSSSFISRPGNGPGLIHCSYVNRSMATTAKR